MDVRKTVGHGHTIGRSGVVLSCAALAACLVFAGVGMAASNTSGGSGGASTSGASTASMSASTSATSGVTSSATSDNASASTGASTSGSGSQTEASYDFEYSDRDIDGTYDESSATKVELSDSGITVDGDGATADGSTLTITSEGTYIVSGTLSDGCIVVDDTDDTKVTLVLSGVDITNADGPAIDIEDADKVFITLAGGSENVLTDGADYADTDEDAPDATIYSACDLTLNGGGSLEVTGNHAYAIDCKDDLKICGGTYTVQATDDAVRGKDSVMVYDGTLDITSTNGDGIKSTNKKDADKGFVSIDGGTVTVSAGDDGIQGKTLVRIDGGTLSITATDDGIHSDNDGAIDGGNITIDCGDDAFHTEFDLTETDGVLLVNSCYEGLEGQNIVISGGENNITASDDGINASTGETDSDDDSTSTSSASGSAAGSAAGSMGGPAVGSASGSASGSAAGSTSGSASGSAFGSANGPMMGGPQGGQQGNGQGGTQGFGGGAGGGFGGMMGADANCTLTIEGGATILTVGGDGLDSNGSLLMSGGTVVVFGPTANDNGSIDSGTTATITGGTIICLGSSGMAETFGSDSTQPEIATAVSGKAGDLVSVVDSDGNVVVSATAGVDYSMVIASSPALVDGDSYTVYVGGTNAETDENGFATSGTLSDDATESATATASTSVTVAGTMGGGMGGNGGGPGGTNGTAPGNTGSGQGASTLPR